MDSSVGFLVYAALFRLAVIAVGGLSIYLGYRLFLADPLGQGKSSAMAEVGGFKLSIRNFWPGAYFALFGTLIIGIMLWQGNPEMVTGPPRDQAVPGNGKQAAARFLETRIRGNALEEMRKLADPGLTLGEAAGSLHRIAAAWRGEGRTGEALAMARLSVRIDADNADYLALFGQLLWDSGDRAKAVTVLDKAAGLDGRYRAALDAAKGAR